MTKQSKPRGEIISENELTDMFGEGGKEGVKEYYDMKDYKLPMNERCFCQSYEEHQRESMKYTRHYKHARKMMKWKGAMTPRRATMIVGELADGVAEIVRKGPKYIITKDGFLINIHDCLT